MDELWCGLDLQAADIAGLPPAPDGPFWPALTDCAATFLAGDTACFGVADIDDLAASAAAGNGDGGKQLQDDGMMDTSGFFAAAENGDHQHHHLMMQQQEQYSSSSLSSKRSLSIDSGGSSSALFPLDDALAAAAATATATPGVFSPSQSHSLPAAPQAQDHPFARRDDDDDDEAAIMRAMMAVISSASPSSSESSSPALSQRAATTTTAQAAAHQPRHRVHVGSRGFAVAPDRTTTQQQQQQQQQHDDAKAAAAAAGSTNNNSSQVYHMMSERKRREKLNDSFHTLRSLLPPCSKKDKTTVLMSAASHLKALEAEVSDLELKNSKLEKYVPGEDGAQQPHHHHHRRAKVHIARAAASGEQLQVSLTVMVMVECDIVELVLHVLERLRWMAGVSVLSVDADTYSPQAVLKALANIKLHIVDGDCWDEALFHEAMTKAVHDATSSPSSASCAAPAPLVAAA
ncbi:hypothetical protein U9M48_018692 [Paspalum notatum var. saurae]|uniref:BHLH domain-containing protein n=1 Tax=Paspalum notatum var. saurae TaxID=547442 RepID=A0AAQ3WQS1_PASNO